MERSKVISRVYNEPVVSALITQFHWFECRKYEQEGKPWSECICFTNIKQKRESIHLVHVEMQGHHCDEVKLVINSQETISLELFSPKCNPEDLHLIPILYYFVLPLSVLERICSAQEIQVLGYDCGERKANMISPIQAFRIYYSSIVDSTKFLDAFSGIRPRYYSFGDWLSGRIGEIIL